MRTTGVGDGGGPPQRTLRWTVWGFGLAAVLFFVLPLAEMAERLAWLERAGPLGGITFTIAAVLIWRWQLRQRETASADPRAWRRFRRNRGALAGGVLAILITGLAFVGPAFAPHDPNHLYEDGLTSVGAPIPPSGRFLLGTDHLGRDELSRLLVGGRVSLAVAFGATSLVVLLGFAVGVVSGYRSDWVDTASMRTVDFIQSLPFLLIAIVINRVIPVDAPPLLVLCLLLGLLSWGSLARITRAKTMQVRELEYVQAARALGASEWRIMTRHIVPNVLGPAIVIGTTLVAQMIIAESAMSFLGLGVRPPTASWGSMLRDAQEMMGYAPRLLMYPGALIVGTVFGFNLLGEGLRDAFDPKE